jgi:PRC-barrel domain
MRRFLTLLAALAIAATLAVALVVVAPAAQEQRASKARPPIGLAVFSSDGKQLGKVVAAGIDEDDQPVLVVEIERPLGFGPHSVAIPAYMFVRKSNQIILTITAKEVADRLSQRTQPYPAEGQ